MRFYILYLFFFIGVVHAQDYFVQVSTLLTKDNAKSIKKQLKNFGYQTVTKKANGSYSVLAGPFKDNNKATIAAHDISNKFLKPQPITLKGRPYIRPKIKRAKPKPRTKTVKQITPKITPKQTKPKKTKLYMSISLGANRVRIHENNINGTLIILNPPDEDGVNYELELGYFVLDKVYFSLGYQKSIFDNTEFNDVLMGVNYRFDKLQDLYPYIGIIGGYSRMNWTENPIDGTLLQDQESFSFLIGLQVGAQTYILEDLSLLVNYKYRYMQQQTLIKVFSEEKEYVHYGMHTLDIGLRYDF